MVANEEQGDKEQRYLIYIGMREHKGKLVQSFYFGDEHGTPDQAREEIITDVARYSFYPKAVKFLTYVQVGAVIPQTKHDDGLWHVGKAVAYEQCQDAEMVALWQIRDRADKAVVERARLQASEKAKANQAMYAGLDFFRAEYARALPQRKIAILADLIAYVTRGERRA